MSPFTGKRKPLSVPAEDSRLAQPGTGRNNRNVAQRFGPTGVQEAEILRR